MRTLLQNIITKKGVKCFEFDGKKEVWDVLAFDTAADMGNWSGV